MNRALLVLLAAMPIHSACASAPPPPDASVPAAAAGPAPLVVWHTYDGPEGTRRYRLAVPAGLDPARPAPLLVMLHGCTQDPDDFAAGTRMDSLAADRGVIVVWPEQPAAAHPQKCWTWYDPAHQARGTGEPAILAAIAREVAARLPVDPTRVYVAGISAGGAMAVNVAASHPDLFAAVAAHSAVAYRAAGNAMEALAAMRDGAADESALNAAAAAAFGAGIRRPPLLVIHGAADAVVNVENGRQLARQWAGGARPASSARGESGGRAFSLDAYADASGAPVAELILVEGLGHAWSGGSSDGTYTDPAGPDASEHVLRFLLRHRRAS
jgi:poly(hydroxyalkanoate) depolymerase family esterase